MLSEVCADLMINLELLILGRVVSLDIQTALTSGENSGQESKLSVVVKA